jgi:hypothetical protein
MRANLGSARIEAVIARALAQAETAGQNPPDQISRAVAAVLHLYPGLRMRDALALVRRVRAKRNDGCGP